MDFVIRLAFLGLFAWWPLELVHAAILRLQALILPVRTLVLSGGH